MFGGNFAPVGWAFCDGSLVPITENETLFNLIGTTYGGDGQSTFALPDLRSRVPLHAAHDFNGFVPGQAGGAESVTLTTPQLPGHSHVPAGNTVGTTPNPSNAVWASWTGSQYSAQAPAAVMNAAAIQNTGGNQPHDNMLPFLTLNFIIALFGVFPTQS
jgi:microcystin-dependent protein